MPFEDGDGSFDGTEQGVVVTLEGATVEVDGALVVPELNTDVSGDGGDAHDGVKGVGMEVVIHESEIGFDESDGGAYLVDGDVF